MATSITGSTNSPYNAPLLVDANYIYSASWAGVGGVSPTFNFNTANPWPTTAQFEVNVYSTAPTGTSTSASYFTIQQSSDNVTWTTVTIFGQPMQGTVYGGSAYSQTLSLPYNVSQYLRLSASNASASSSPQGTWGWTLYI